MSAVSSGTILAKAAVVLCLCFIGLDVAKNGSELAAAHTELVLSIVFALAVTLALVAAIVLGYPKNGKTDSP